MTTLGYTFSTPLRVRWSEVDRQGIVFNGHYLTYFDVGITEYWRAIGLPYPDGLAGAGSDLYAVKTVINYHASALYDDILDIGLRVAAIGNSSITFAIGIHRGEQRLVSGEVVYVNADPASRKAQTVPAQLRAAIEAFETAHGGDKPPAPSAMGQE